MTTETFEDITRTEPERSLVEPRQAQGRPQQQRPHHDAPPGRRPQAALPGDRLQARQGRRAGQGGAHRVRPEPLGAHRPAALRRRREALHPGAARASRWATRSSPAPTPTSRSATRCRSRTSRPARRSTTSSSTPAAARQLVRSAGTSAQLQAKEKGYGVVRLPSSELRRIRLACRATVGEVGNSDHSNTRRRQGRTHALARRAPDRARHGHEPGRPSARRRRGQDHRRAPSGHAVGRARRSATARASKHKRSDKFIIRGRKRGKHS